MADFTVAAGIKPPENTFDPMKTAAGAMGLQQNMLQNRLLGLNLQGKQALGQIIGQNTDPQTGETDWQGVSANASQDPSAAIMLPEIQKQVLDRQLSQVQLQRQQLGLTGEQWGAVGNAAMELLGRKGEDGKPADLKPDDVVSTLTSRARYRGLLQDGNFAARLANFTSDLKGKDPAAVRQALSGIAIMADPTAERVGLVNGPIENLNTGSQILTRQASPLTGKINIDAVTNVTRSPAEKSSQVQVWNAQTHQYEYKPSGSVVGDMAPGAVPGQPDTGATTPAEAPKAAPAIGETATGEANAHQAIALQQRAAIVPQRKAALAEMGQLAGEFRPGPKADLERVVGGLAAQYGLASPGAVKGAAAQETFNKLAAQIALDQWGTLGGSGSNEQLATTMHANPNAALTRMGIKNVVALLQGNEDAIGAQYGAWQKWKATHGPASYDTFLQGWNKYYDPRVFQYEHMDAGSRKAMIGGMSAADRKTFARDQNIAKQAGWLGQ